jgi:hypothetical protein
MICAVSGWVSLGMMRFFRLLWPALRYADSGRVVMGAYEVRGCFGSCIFSVAYWLDSFVGRCVSRAHLSLVKREADWNCSGEVMASWRKHGSVLEIWSVNVSI